MISIHDIEKEAYKPSIPKAYELFRNGDVEGMHIIRKDPFTVISAQMNGSKRIPYKMKAMINESTNRIIKYECDCPAYEEYSGLCKHCAAMLMEYVKNRDRLPSKPKTTGDASAVLPRTNRTVQNMLNYYGMYEKIPYLQPKIQGKIELIPSLSIQYNHIYAEFRIGASKKYIVKNIHDFAQAVKSSSEYTYGKGLSFYHYEEAFTEESRPFVRFICQMAEANDITFSPYAYGGGSRYRKMLLKGYSLDRFMEFFIGKQLEIELNQVNTYEVVTGRPPAFLNIKEVRGGITLSVSRYIAFSGVENIYYMDSAKLYVAKIAQQRFLNPFRKCFDGTKDGKIFIGEQELPLFCRELLPLLRQQYQVNQNGFDESSYLPDEVNFEIYLDMPQQDMIQGKVYAVYHEKQYNIMEEAKLEQNRNIKEELRVSRAVQSYFNAYDESEHALVLAGEEEKLYQFLCEGIPKLSEYGTVSISDSIKKLKIIPTPHVKIGVSIEGNLLEFELQSKDMPIEKLAEILSKYNRKKRYYRLKDGTFIQMGEELDGLLNLSQTLQLKESDLRKGKIEIPKYRSLYLDGMAKEFGMEIQKDRNFKNLVRNMKTAEENDFEIPKSLDKILRGYQKSGFIWLKTLMQNGFGGILADDMGLGKTLQVIALFQSVYEEQKAKKKEEHGILALVISPASLVYNWQKELERFAPTLPVITVTGSVQERKEKLKEATMENILITSYDLLKRDMEEYQKKNFLIQVVDEAQYIKNATALAAKAVKMIKAGFKVALTGTPIENRLSELWSIFDYLLPGFLYSYTRFREILETPIVGNKDTEAMDRLGKMIRPFVLRRLKKDVLTDLPEKTEKIVYAKMEGEQQELYQAHTERLKLFLEKQSEEELKTAKLYILSELTRLRQLCCNPALLYEDYQASSAKLDICMDTVKMAVEGGHKVLIFSQFVSNFTLLEERLKQEGFSWYRLTGSTKKEERIHLVEQFNQNEVPVFLISLKAGGTGLNLTSADIVIHYDPWWNLAVQNQATDRAHRIGQKNAVTVYKLIIKDTIEEKIVELQEKKSDLAEQVLGKTGLAETGFCKEELLKLLQ